ncbi:MAG: hypothetical protein Q4P07_03455 [Ornithinimicrobium sp.]|uniref:hypothetical protein n=1 Tax=Ornithinimicrobium sp. TaxID=1977084 RepID=UPI0026DF4B2A|nr:hypothetical protein [Ornithinimicrobium sp.]MDO5739184.1 hypothetical protein [Ornithinimicrobium sp.]
MFFKTDAERAAAQGSKARQDAAEAGSSAASGARNLGAAVLATLAEATAPADSKKERRHAQKTRAKAMKAAGKDRDAAGKAASKAADHGRKAADHGRSALDKKAAEAGGTVAALSAAARDKAVPLGEAAKERAVSAGHSAAAAASHAGERLAERAGPLGETAKEKAGLSAAVVAALAAAIREKAEHTRDRAVTGVDHGIDAAVPRVQDGVAAVGPKVDHLRDLINDELLPKLQSMIGDVQSGKDRVLAKDEGVVATLTGAPKSGRSKKGGVMIALGLLAAAGAGLAWYLSQQQRDAAADPWASQGGGADPWASRTPTTSAAPAVELTSTPPAGSGPVSASTQAVSDGDVPTTASSMSTSSTDLVSPTVADAALVDAAPLDAVPVDSVDGADALDATPSATGASDYTGAHAGDGARMLESEEIDDLAFEEPVNTDEQAPGEGMEPTDRV